jgi:hypothetical protein
MEFDGVVFFGRLGEQALAMFHLEEELPHWQGARVLDCPGGPGSLAARLRPCGIDVTAIDPLYALGDEALEQRALADLERTLATLAASDDLRPDFDLQACRRQHLAALQAFLADRLARPDRYIAASLPDLPFPARAFDLVLSGHLLFSYAPRRDGGLMVGDGLDLAWHRRALAELCRVCAVEVRLYPAHTIERDARHHPYAETLLAELPSAWRGGFFASSYDQGHQGLTHGLTLMRRDRPPQPASPSSRSMPATTTSATSWMR